MIKKVLLTVFLVLVQTMVFGVTKTFNVASGNWNTAANWLPIGVPVPNDDVTVGSGTNVTLDTNITIGSGTYTFNGNVTDNGIHTLTAITNNGKLIISNNSTTTFGGLVSLDNSSITVDTGSTLIVGPLSIANGTTITIAGTLIVNGDLTDNNNGGPGSSFTVSGYVQVYGSYSAPVGSVSVSGAGVFQTTGTIITTGNSTVGGSTNNCTTGPCSSGSISCGDGTNSYFSSVSPTNQVLCSGQTISPLSFVSGTTVTSYQWQISTTNGGTGFADITGATSNSYTPSQPSVTTWYRMKYFTSCSVVTPLISPSSKISVTNNAPPVAGTIGGGNISYCSGTNSTTMTLSGYTATGFQWQSSSDNSTFSDVSGATSASFTAANVTSTSYYRVVVSKGLCNTVNTASVVINKVSAPSAPTVGIPTQPTCATPTGSVVLSGLPASGIWTLTRSGTSSATTTGTGTSTTISGLASGTYTYTVSNSSCTSGASSNVGIDAITNTWNVVSGVGSWTNTLTSTQAITFNGNYNSAGNSAGDLTACSCTVNAGVTVNINSGDTLRLTDKLSVATATSPLGVVTTLGSIYFDNKASLVQINNVANSGEIDYVRTTNTGVINTDYTYWSSPVTGFTLGGVSRNKTISDKYYSYEPTAIGEDWKQESVSTVMSPGKGYIVRGPEPGIGIISGAPYTATFTGIPNNGHYEIIGLFADKSYLLGNPYPSALDADTFLKDNAAVLNGTLYFWTHNTAIKDRNLISNPGSGAFAYTSNDYATYNATGGVGAAPPDSGATTGPATGSSEVPTGKIGSGQGFFASSKTSLSGSKIVFDNTMRVGVNGITGNNSQFFKSRNPKTTTKTAIEKNRIWLNLTNTQGAFKQTLVGYITDATNGYDDRFDGESFDGNEFVDFYSVNQDKNLTIQGRALPFDENDEVPLGYRTTINGAFTINIDQADGSLTNQAVYVEDKLTNTVTDLKSGNYTFNTVAGTFNDRFVLRYKDNSTAKTLATANFDSQANKVLVSNKNKQIKINSFSETIDKVTIYDVLGRQIYQKDQVNSNELSISNLGSRHQVLVVKTSLQNGTTVSNKIIY